MMDLSTEEAQELADFTSKIRDRIEPLFGGATITEHGRIAACLEAAADAHEPHCLHAHRLVFPGLPEIAASRITPELRWRNFDSFLEAFRGFTWDGQYLYVESAEGVCTVTPAPGIVPRQFFRGLAAGLRGEPEAANWRAQPRAEIAAASAARLREES
jgi:hypothetical protein